MILIPKPGKLPSIEHLRPFSLTSCVGKVMEHVLMGWWQQYLEDKRLYPDTMFGFREKLGTHDAMALIKECIVNVEKREGRALLGLDLQSAFDKVKHSAILAQVSVLGLGARSYAYICDFLTRRTPKLCVGELNLEERELGSVGMPQGSVISPLLFNIVVIKVAKRLEEQGIEHSTYADDITLWSLSDMEEEAQDDLQEAVNAIKEDLEGTGLVCSPSK